VATSAISGIKPDADVWILPRTGTLKGAAVA